VLLPAVAAHCYFPFGVLEWAIAYHSITVTCAFAAWLLGLASCWRVSFPIPPQHFFFFRARADFRVRGHEYSIVTAHSILQMNNRDIPHPFLTRLLASINCYVDLAPSMFQQNLSLVRPEDNLLHFHLVKQFISLFCLRQRHDLICHET